MEEEGEPSVPESFGQLTCLMANTVRVSMQLSSITKTTKRRRRGVAVVAAAAAAEEAAVDPSDRQRKRATHREEEIKKRTDTLQKT